MTHEIARTGGLLHQVSRSVFWNTALLPIVTAAGVLLSIVIRRRFALESGIYDVVLGVVNSILFYSSFGVAGSLARFLPEFQMRGGRHAAARLIGRLAAIRMALIVVIVLPLALWTDRAAEWLGLASGGGAYLWWLTALLIGRGALDFVYRALDAFLEQLHVNVLSLANSLLDLCLVATVVILGLHIDSVIGALGVSAIATAVAAVIVLAHVLDRVPPDAPGEIDSPSADRIWKLSAVTYFRDLALYFATPAFASPMLLAALGSPEPVALFATGYFVAASTVALVVSGFRGIYRPTFARVLAGGDRGQLQRTFDVVNKAQVLAVVPAGIGLAVMAGDYIPLLYGSAFDPAVPVARVLVLLLYAETAFAVGLLVLWADERYKAVLAAQIVTLAAAPLFVWAAGRYGLVPAAVVIGASRLMASLIGHAEAGRTYGVSYPWAFASRVLATSLAMGAVLLVLRPVAGTSAAAAVALTVLGVVLVLAGLRLFRVVGADEAAVLERTNLPGRQMLIAWLRR